MKDEYYNLAAEFGITALSFHFTAACAEKAGRALSDCNRAFRLLRPHSKLGNFWRRKRRKGAHVPKRSTKTYRWDRVDLK